jgi:hypothetical protein
MLDGTAASYARAPAAGDFPPSSITRSSSDSRIIVRLPTFVRRSLPELSHD